MPALTANRRALRMLSVFALLGALLLASSCANQSSSTRGAGVGAALGSGIALATGAGVAGVVGGGLIGGSLGYAGGWAAGN